MDKSAASDQRTMSLHLARTLDQIGLNTLTVKKRRHMYLCMEQVINVHQRLNGENRTCYHFGSQTEGTTTPGLKSDIDTLSCGNTFNVIDDLADWRLGTTNLLMLQEDTAPGYCRLQLLRDDVPLAKKQLPLIMLASRMLVSIDNKALLTHNMIPVMADQGLSKHGPAYSGQHGYDNMEYDLVTGYHCNKWPRQAAEFIRRRRRHGWPSKRLIEEATRHGVFLVPVGHKLSTTDHLEWRISASLAERCLMFSLNIVHIKCYVVLKILMKSFVETRIHKCISSYHCKTALLYCIENTEHAFWTEDNLLPCVIRCLEMLRNWVADLFCPQFIMKDENLFAGKVTTENRDLLLSILTEMIDSDGRVLLRVTIDDLGQKLQTRMNTKPSCVPLTNSLASVWVFGDTECHMQTDLNYYSLLYTTQTLDNSGDHISVMRTVYRDIVKLLGMIEGSNTHSRQVINAYITHLSCWLGSLMASFSLAYNKKVPRKALQLICTAAKYDISSILKLASILHFNGKNRKAETVLQLVEDNSFVGRNILHVICLCYKHTLCVAPGIVHHMTCALKSKKARVGLFAHCVRFSRHEIHCAPPALRHEMYRAVGGDMKHRDPMKDKWMNLAVVDCLPYMYYLQYLTYGQLGKHALQKRSRRNLERCVTRWTRSEESLPHRETAWNLLGQCWESELRLCYALTCYRKSLQIRRRNNAANWHVAILWYKMAKDLRLLPRITVDQLPRYSVANVHTTNWLIAIMLYSIVTDHQTPGNVTVKWNVIEWHLAIWWYVAIKHRGLLPSDAGDQTVK